MDWQARLTELLRVRLFSIGDTDTTVGSALAIVAILVVTYLVARTARRLAGHYCTRHGIDDDVLVYEALTVQHRLFGNRVAIARNVSREIYEQSDSLRT